MNYILKGDPKEVAKVLQENRIRVDRGVIAFTPCQPEPVLDTDSIATLRQALEASEKSCQEMAAGHVELAGATRDVIAIITENGITVPEDITARLAKFGIIIPNFTETAENTAEIGENLTESVPNATDSASLEFKHETPDAMDDKHIEVEDLQEVDLDADDKNLSGDDSKDVPANDAKEAAPAKKKSKRSKKSE